MSNAAPWAATAGNKFREVARTTDNPTTKLLAEGLTALTEAFREQDAKLEKMKSRCGRSSRLTHLLAEATHRLQQHGTE
ncbi:MAG TPA: hypothetical protein VHT50_07640 [Mycobacterium sp.]|nr:hypothetical protein [Mycobacterium sp.]